MLFIRLIEAIIIRVATFLIQLILAKDFNELDSDEFDFNEVCNKIVDSAKKIFL